MLSISILYCDPRLCAGMQGVGAVSEEAAFADIVAELMQGHISSPEAVSRFAEVCEDSAARLRCAQLVERDTPVLKCFTFQLAAILTV